MVLQTGQFWKMCENGGNHVCRVCSREYVYDRKKGHRKSICNSCNANHKRALIKKKALAYKGGKCVRCGYDKCDAALAFHHTDPSQKEFQISGSHSASWDKMMKELDKCVVLCINCHAETHAAP